MRPLCLLLLGVLTAACTSMKADLPMSPDFGTTTGTRAAQLVDDLGRWPADRFEFQEVRIVGDTLEATVTYGGGCREHDFALVFANVFLESYPVQMRGMLSHDANGDMCRALLGQTLHFDLTPLRDAYRAAYGETSATIVLQGNWPGRLEYAF
jgi:hypothetical protein